MENLLIIDVSVRMLPGAYAGAAARDRMVSRNARGSEQHAAETLRS